jgi:Lipopolysaccharide kinase (Kdo/WaaP) family
VRISSREVAKYGKVASHSAPALPEVVDAGELRVSFPDGAPAILSCVVLKYVDADAQTLVRFLSTHHNLDATMFERFVERVGGALESLEEAGLEHGDLHEGNILVVPGKHPGEAIEFWVIDYIGVPTSPSNALEHPTDLDCFCEHLLKAAILGAEKYPCYSVRHLLGDRVYRVLEGLRRKKYATFREVLDDFRKSSALVPDDYFQPPPLPFEWLRVEWIPSPDWLVKLFSPVPSRFEIISRFGNTWISGPRGCGKSHYLRVLAFQPSLYTQQDPTLDDKLATLGYDFRKAYGVLFACRLGEFKAFDPEAMGSNEFDFDTRMFLKHILVLKIITKTLFTLREGLETTNHKSATPVLALPTELTAFVAFFEERFGSIALVSPTTVKPTFLQCLGIAVARENADVAIWNRPALRPPARRLDETDLDHFFRVIKQTFPDLSSTRFYVLVDDATYGHIHFETQKLLNSLIRSQQANHCFKVTFEKYMYTLDSADDRAIDPRHEVTYVDLGEVSVKAHKDTGFDYIKYMAEVVNLRLRAQNWNHGIEDILGRSQDAREFLAALSGVHWGADTDTAGHLKAQSVRHPAYYAGWNIICSVAHGSIRTLLEIVENIFQDVKATADTLAIPLKNQDAAVRSFSRRQFRILTFVPGALEGEPVGQQLQSIIAGIGEMSSQYLRNYNTSEPDRWYETISIERLDDDKLDVRAGRLLEELIKAGLLLNEGVTFSRADIGLGVRYDLNKIFAPAFEITYRVRNHLYVSGNRLEELLLSPNAFVRRHRQKLDSLVGAESKQGRLF